MRPSGVRRSAAGESMGRAAPTGSGSAAERELKDIWTNACMVTHLAQVIPVKLRPGQLPGDFARRAERFAAAVRVPAVEVATLTADNQWISIRLLEPFWIEWPWRLPAP